MIWFIVGCIVAGIMVGVFSFVIAKLTVLNSVKKISRTLEEVAQTSNLTHRVHIDSNDEIGILFTSSNHLLDSFSEIIGKLKKNSHIIDRLLHVIQNNSSNLDSVSNDMLQQSHEFDDATKALSTSMNKVTAMADTSSQDMGNIAAAVTSMSTTIDEISKMTEEADSKAELAVKSSAANFQNIKKLEQIGTDTANILESVDTITKQTELIAVNANIEAVRAGTAGKAFAVVAGEVKTLAEETTRAVIQIRKMINQMAIATTETTGNISCIDEFLSDISSIISKIKKEIRIQNVDAESISESVDASLVRVVSSSRRAHESSDVVMAMSENMQQINSAVSSAHDAEISLKKVIAEFEVISRDLQESVDSFVTA